jgi:hypothetical protein
MIFALVFLFTFGVIVAAGSAITYLGLRARSKRLGHPFPVPIFAICILGFWGLGIVGGVFTYSLTKRAYRARLEQRQERIP